LPSRARNTPRVAARLFVDSGAWIALRSRRDQHHAEAERGFRAAVNQGIPLVTTDLVIAEIHRLTLFRAGIDAAYRTLERIDASPSVTICHATVADHQAARQWLERLAPRPITYTDAISFAVMQRTACSHYFGFDDDFAAAGFERFSGTGR
jgi:predicted nucleic acid-binding protein